MNDPGGELHRLPHAASGEQTDLKEYLLLLPRLARLIWRLTRDPRVPARSKAILVLLGAYIVSPVDLIPDFIPGLGQLDDIVVAAFALDQIINRIPDHIVREHWDGDEDVLQLVREILDISTTFMPKWLKSRLGPTSSS
ncbi:MAG: hypothetical protein QOG21_1966 [Actinomycetota bacterium]|jgi:uncharacterized membrane protein YkvA (DUF1232 family)|nr:hypothetical protein [Actinomycetota bacterium]